MVDSKYGIAYNEVLEILKCIPIEDYNKIPKTKIELFETNANENFVFNYNPSKTLEEQNVSKIARGIIAILFRDYWATEIQREKILNKQRYDRIKIEEEKQEKYNLDNIFGNNNKNVVVDNTEKKQELALIETNDIKYYKKIWRFLTKFLRK